MNEGAVPGHRGRPGPRRAAPRGRLRRRDDRRPGRGDRARSTPGAPPARLAPSRSSPTPPTSSPSWSAAAGTRTRHRPDLRPRPAGRLRAGRHRPGGSARAARARPRGVHPAVHGLHRRARAGDARLPGIGLGRLRLRQQHPAASRGTPAWRTPSTSPASCRPSSGRSSARARAPSAGPPCRATPNDILKTDAALAELFPEDAVLHRWLRLAEEKVPFQGLPARICWLGYGERAQGRAADQRDGARRASCPRRS